MYNPGWHLCKDLKSMLIISEAIARCAHQREESRGAHSRQDYPERDDDKWLVHSLAYLQEDSVQLEFKGVDTSIFVWTR